MIPGIRNRLVAHQFEVALRASRFWNPRRFLSGVMAFIAAGVLLAASTGCAPTVSTFDIVNFRDDAGLERFHETFDEAWYDVDGTGNVDIVLRRSQPREGGRDDAVVQLVHVRSFWRSIPGRTVAERTQLNGVVTYGVISGGLGATFEGAGSVFFVHDPKKGELTGSLDLARLKPARELTPGSAVFQRVELSGTFVARHNPSRTVALRHQLEQTFRTSAR